jgi:nitrile hydratase beta subunit
MNGIHDMGGMHGFGLITREVDEPVFHERWEARAHALHTAVGAWRKWDTDLFRFKVECISCEEYLRMSYYERRFLALTELVIEKGLVSKVEFETGHPADDAPRVSPALNEAGVKRMFSPRRPVLQTEPASPRYQIGDAVRTKNINPVHHTRLPRYARGKVGIIDILHGEWVFPDANVQGLGKTKQHLYTVRFTARGLWGDAASSQDTVCVELWEDYLDAA